MAKYSRAFWTANAAELFERMAYYAVFIVVTLYLSNTLGFSDIEASIISGLFSGGLYLLPLFTGALADKVGSTAALLKHAVKSDKKRFIVATESGILHEMQKQCPDKEFIPAPPEDSTCACNECNYMRLNTLEKLRDCLRDETPEIVVDKKVAERAIRPIQRMLDISAQLGL